MNTPDGVVGCSTCGALYTPTHGDTGHCAACSTFLPEDPAAPAANPAPRAAAKGHALAGDYNRGGRPSAVPAGPDEGWPVRRIAKGLAAVALIAAIGATAAFQRQRLADAWSGLQRHSPAQAWAATRHLAAEGWTALRRYLPLDAPQADPAASATSAKPSRARHRAKAVARK